MKKIALNITLCISLLLLMVKCGYAPSFIEQQMQYPRVRGAKTATEQQMRLLFQSKGLNYPPSKIFMRVLKTENLLELWGFDNKNKRYKLVKTYDACAMSGVLGPKRKQGDFQVPEGFYHISLFNPYSNFHLSMKINYPNASDRVLSKHSDLGGDIFIHGQCASIGCVSITNPYIKELYWLSAQVKAQGQRQIPVHVFPARMSSFKYSILKHMYRNNKKMLRFWANLKEGYDYFHRTGHPPKVAINKNGVYSFK